jgi:hypothetical protein
MTRKPKLGAFRTQQRNVNQHTERGIALLDKSLRQDGWIGAITVAADGETFDGSARLERVADAMPEADPIVVDVDGTRPVILRRTDIGSANDPRAKRLAVAANAIASADWNPDGELLAALAAEDEIINQYLQNDDTAITALMKTSEQLEEKNETILKKNFMRVLVSVPIDNALDAKQIIDQLQVIDGCQIDYGAN